MPGSQRVRTNILSRSLIEDRSERIPFSGCWIWMGCSHPRGYGEITMRQKSIMAHVASWCIFKGDPGNFHVLHRCDVTACVNPDHLFLGTHQENMADREKKGRNKLPTREQRFRILSDDQVIQIRSSDLPIKILASQFSVSPWTIINLRRKKSDKRKHLCQ